MNADKTSVGHDRDGDGFPISVILSVPRRISHSRGLVTLGTDPSPLAQNDRLENRSSRIAF